MKIDAEAFRNREKPSPPGEAFPQKYGGGCLESSPLLLTEGGTAQAVSGVEGNRYDIRTARKDDTPHIRHGLRPMTPSPQGEGFSLKPLPPTSNDRTLPPSPASPVSAYRIRRAGHAAAPTHKLDSPYRPSSGPFGATFPQGKANPRQVGSLLQSPTVHPLRATQAWPTSPYTPGGSAPLGGYTKSPAAGFPHCRWSFICFLGFTRCLLAR